MRKTLLLFLAFSLALPSCSSRSGYTTPVVKPKYHHWFFNRHKDKKTKRTRIVRMKS